MFRQCVLLACLAFLLVPYTALAAEPSGDEAIKKSAEPVVVNILSALKAGDYARMARDFSPKMLAAVPPEKLASTNKEDILPKFGEFVSKSFSAIQYGDEFVTLTYAAEFTKEKKMQVVVSFKKDDAAMKVQGLFIRPFPMTHRASAEEEAALKKTLSPFAEHFFAALKAGDWAGAERDFSDKMKAALPPDKLKEGYEKGLFAQCGAFVSARFDRIDLDATYTTVYYIASYAKGTQTEVKFVFPSGDAKPKLDGLWEKPL